MQSFEEYSFKGKRVLMRVDFNVPFDKQTGLVSDDSRIRRAVPTIEYVVNRGGRVILMSHMGRPGGKVVEEFSMRRIKQLVEQLVGKSIVLASDCVGAEVVAQTRSLHDGDIMLLENVRFHEEEGGDEVSLEKIQTISTFLEKDRDPLIAACQMRFSPDKDASHLFVSNAGINTISIYDRDLKTGLLTMKGSLPIGGEYPKDFCIFPDEKHIAVANNESGTITFLNVDYEHGLLSMSARELEVDEPNSICMVKCRG